MKRKLLFSALALTIFTGVAFALKKDEVTFKRTFTLDKVDIAIETSGNLENVLPESQYAYDIEVVNQGEPCYVRILDNEALVVTDTDWKKIGDYYYYPESVNSNDIVSFCNSITTNDFDSNQEDIRWNIQAEAIQSAHFELDLESEDPFQGQEIMVFGGNV